MSGYSRALESRVSSLESRGLERLATRDSRLFSKSTYLTTSRSFCTSTPMSVSATSEASLADGDRPPTASFREPAPPSGVADTLPTARPTAAPRPPIRPLAWPPTLPGARHGFSTDHPYVRRFWTAAIGPGAVADLMRLAVAAQRGRSLLRPEALDVLVREDLARWVDGRLFVRTTIPPLSPGLERRLTPELKRSHRSLQDRPSPIAAS